MTVLHIIIPFSSFYSSFSSAHHQFHPLSHILLKFNSWKVFVPWESYTRSRFLSCVSRFVSLLIKITLFNDPSSSGSLAPLISHQVHKQIIFRHSPATLSSVLSGLNDYFPPFFLLDSSLSICVNQELSFGTCSNWLIPKRE